VRAPVCTIDSSCVIALDHLGLVSNLSLIFSAVLVPVAVRKELTARPERTPWLEALFAQYAFFERCNEYDQGAVDLLLIEWHRTGDRDRGEAEAVMQASQLGVGVIVDDKRGRNLARKLSLEVYGTFGVLRRFHQLGFLSSHRLREHLEVLRDCGIRLPWQDVNRVLTEMGLSPIDAPRLQLN
jgi:predicted nucleic acid-binding protein